MASQVLLKKSSVAAKVPELADLAYGELALNYEDGRLYYKTSANAITSFNAKGTATDIGVATGTSLNLTGNVTVSGAFYGDGSGLTGVSTTSVGGYFNSTLIQFPVGDYGAGELYIVVGATQDPFGVTLVTSFSCMDPQGSMVTVEDFGVFA